MGGITDMHVKDELETGTGESAPLRSRRQFMRTAAVTGGAGLLSAGLAPLRAQERAKKASPLVLPAATKDVTFSRYMCHRRRWKI